MNFFLHTRKHKDIYYKRSPFHWLCNILSVNTPCLVLERWNSLQPHFFEYLWSSTLENPSHPARRKAYKKSFAPIFQKNETKDFIELPYFKWSHRVSIITETLHRLPNSVINACNPRNPLLNLRFEMCRIERLLLILGIDQTISGIVQSDLPGKMVLWCRETDLDK